jgi:hypothetical protein
LEQRNNDPPEATEPISVAATTPGKGSVLVVRNQANTDTFAVVSYGTYSILVTSKAISAAPWLFDEARDRLTALGVQSSDQLVEIRDVDQKVIQETLAKYGLKL